MSILFAAAISAACTVLLFAVVFTTADDEIGTELDPKERE